MRSTKNSGWFTTLFPIAGWLAKYKSEALAGDLTAGAITAILLIPQAMAYSQLAGLPLEIGLYASIAPPILYAIFGSSRTLAVGPVAVASLMVAGALSAFWVPGSAEYVAGALMLSMLVGIILTALGLARAGALANLLSHPVMAGFTNAAVLLIAVSQFKHLLGISVPAHLRVDQSVAYILSHASDINMFTASIGIGGIVLLLALRRFGATLLVGAGLSSASAATLTRLGPLLIVLAGIVITSLLNLDQSAGVRIVGAIPAGLPELSLPLFDFAVWRQLLPAAAAIALVSFVESVTVAKVLAARKREKIDSNQELVGLGIANIGAAFSGASPVCGGFSRSAVNFAAGANTQLAAIVTALIIALTLVFFTPLFYNLPQAILGAIILVSVVTLFDLHTLRLSWNYHRADAASFIITFAAVLAVGIEAGIATGVVLSIALLLWRTTKPHMAIVGRVGGTEHYRNVLRHSVQTYAHVLAVRVDESLYFANTRSLEDRLLEIVSQRLEIEHVVLICSAVNFIDTSALETLENLANEFKTAGITLHLAEVKGPVMDGLQRTDILKTLAPGRVFLSTHEAMLALVSCNE